MVFAQIRLYKRIYKTLQEISQYFAEHNIILEEDYDMVEDLDDGDVFQYDNNTNVTYFNLYKYAQPDSISHDLNYRYIKIGDIIYKKNKKFLEHYIFDNNQILVPTLISFYFSFDEESFKNTIQNNKININQFVNDNSFYVKLDSYESFQLFKDKYKLKIILETRDIDEDMVWVNIKNAFIDGNMILFKTSNSVPTAKEG